MSKFGKYLLVLFVLVVGIGTSLVGFWQFILIEEAEKQKNFLLAASDRMVAIERSIQLNLDAVLSIKSFFESGTVVQREQFRSFVTPVLKRNDAVKALEWIPVVPADERANYVAIARSEGFKNFEFVERSVDGKVVSVQQREDYYPVFYVEPMTGNEGAFGFDLGSSISRRLALETARDGGRMTTSESITLVQNGRKGVLLFAPIYRTGTPTHSIDLRRQNIVGFALGVIEIQKMIVDAFAQHHSTLAPGGIDIHIFEDQDRVKNSLVYASASRRRANGKVPLLSKAASQIGLHVTHKVAIGDRNWLLVARPLVPKYGAGIPRSAWGILLLGLFLSTTVAFLFKSNIDRNRLVEGLVVDRTSELLAKTEQIELMHDVTVVANEADDIEDATKTCIELMCKRAGWQVGHAYFVTAGRVPKLVPSKIWYFEHADGHEKFREITMQTEFEIGSGLLGRAYQQREPVWVDDISTSEYYQRNVSGDKLHLTSAIAMPVMIEKNVVAVLEFYYAKRTEPDETLVKSLVHIGFQLGRVFERKKVENMKNEFISTVSHELRTPLTSIKGSLGLIVSGVIGELSGNLSDMVNIAYNNSDRLVRLINDILDIEKIEVGKMDFNMAVLELAPLMERVVAENQGFVVQQNVTLKLNNIMPEAKIFADSDRIIQAITNLISNAARFSPDGAAVEIDVIATDQGFHISVLDHGPGIPEDFRRKIFSKFAQADSASGQGGTGLGLSISKAIIEEHFGTIGFETEIGKGASFYIDLPKHIEPKNTRSDSDPTAAHLPRVLICEDDLDIAKLLESVLGNDGVRVDVVHNAADAKQALLDRHYDAMTLDLALPDQNGVSLIREIRQIEETRDVPIVVVSAKATDGKNGLNAHAFGVVDWIQKPIDQAYLNTVLQRAIQQGSRNKPHILHIEDDPDVAKVVAALIDDIATITLAQSFAEGKALLESQSFDLVVLDLMLPDGVGEDLVALARDGETEAPPFIVFSAKEMDTLAISDNIKATLVKSRTSNEQLVSTIRSAITPS